MLPPGRADAPHSREAEEYLLSCCFIDGPDVVARCLKDQISPLNFMRKNSNSFKRESLS